MRCGVRCGLAQLRSYLSAAGAFGFSGCCGRHEKKNSQNLTSEDPLFFDLGELLDWNSPLSLMVLAQWQQPPSIAVVISLEGGTLEQEKRLLNHNLLISRPCSSFGKRCSTSLWRSSLAQLSAETYADLWWIHSPDPGPRHKLPGVSFLFFGSIHGLKFHHFHLTGNFLANRRN